MSAIANRTAHPNDLPPEDRVVEAMWWQADAAYLARWADKYRDQGKDWLAIAVQDNAAHSARKSREAMGLEEPTP